MLMIHEMNMKTKIPSDGIATFDDGLYSQYVFGRNLPNDKIYFICPSFIDNGVNDIGQKCMGVHHIKKLINEGIDIGAHSYYHTKIWKLPDLKHQVYHIQRDTKLMMEWFGDRLDITPTKYCFPYNEELNGVYKATLKPYGFTDFYGSSRVDIPA